MGGQVERNKLAGTDFSPEEQLDIDFRLDEIITPGFFDLYLSPTEIAEFYQNMFDRLMNDWYEGFDETDELMLIFPFGRLYKQINDGRYAKLLHFFNARMPQAQFRRNVAKLYQKFVCEFIEFNENFDKFTENRDDNDFKKAFPKMSYDSFSAYRFKSNSWIEEVCENFFACMFD